MFITLYTSSFFNGILLKKHIPPFSYTLLWQENTSVWQDRSYALTQKLTVNPSAADGAVTKSSKG